MLVGWRALWYDALPEDENAPRRRRSSAVGRPEAAACATKGSPCEYLSVAMVA